MLDIELPLWTIRPNWREGIRERLAWLTDVLSSSWGTEQRRALRLSPRRDFEMTFNPIDEVRSYFELWLHRLGSQEFMLPLFHDRGRLSADLANGSETIPVDTAYREFEVGGLALLLGDDPWTYDKLEIVAIAADSITVAEGGVTRNWPEGSSIYPLRRSRIEQESASGALTSRVGSATMRFQLNQANDIPDEGEWATLFNDTPVLLDKPNWRESRSITFSRNSLVLDNDHGLRNLADDAGRAFTLDTHNRMMRGRAEHWAFRQFLYRLRGQQASILVPTFNRDLELSRSSAAGDSKLDVKKIGYSYTGGAVSGRTYVLIGGEIREITGATAPFDGEERLALSAPVGGAGLPAGTTGSFADTCRLASDEIEILHHTDTDGAAECQLSFKAFRDTRTTPTVIDYPIPVATVEMDMCGEPAPEDADCVTIEEGFHARLYLEYDAGLNIPASFPFVNAYMYRGGVYIAGSILTSADAYWTYDESGGAKLGMVGTWWFPDSAPVGEPGFPLDLLAGGRPDEIQLTLQFAHSAFSCGGVSGSCGGRARALISFPNEPILPLTVTFGSDPIGDVTFSIERTWPRDYNLAIPT